MIIETLVQYLADQNIAVIGQSLFAHQMPETALYPSVMLKKSVAGTRLDYELPGYIKDSVQAIVRANTYQEGFNLAQQVSDALTFYNKLFTGFNVKYVRPRHLPVVYPLSAASNLEFSVNFDAVYVIVA